MTMSKATAPRPYSWLWVLIVVMTLVTLAIGGVGLHYIETRMVTTAGETLALTAAEVSDKLDRFSYERYVDVQMIARAFGAQPDNREFQLAYVAWMRTSYPDYLWMGVTNARGQIVAATDPTTVGRDYSAQPWFQAVRNGRAVHVEDVEPFAVMGGADSVAFTAPITGPHGEFLGVVTTRMGIPALENVLTRTLVTFQQREGLGGALEYQFLTEKGIAFVDSDLQHKGNINLKQLGLPAALLSERSLFGYVEEEHQRRHVPVITGYARTQGLGDFEGLHWTVLMRMDRRDVLAPIRAVLWNLGLAGCAVVVPIFGLLLWTVKRVRREHLIAQQERALARDAEVSLRESQAHTWRIIATALDAFIGMDAAGVITDWNVQAEQMFGWPRHEAIGRLLSATIIPAPHREAHERELHHFLATGEGPVLNTRIEITACHLRLRGARIKSQFSKTFMDQQERFNDTRVDPRRDEQTDTLNGLLRLYPVPRLRQSGELGNQTQRFRHIVKRSTIPTEMGSCLQVFLKTNRVDAPYVQLVAQRQGSMQRGDSIRSLPPPDVMLYQHHERLFEGTTGFHCQPG
jgi:two-component system, cell cycle sensor histidine kinase and response regulator CckA